MVPEATTISPDAKVQDDVMRVWFPVVSSLNKQDADPHTQPFDCPAVQRGLPTFVLNVYMPAESIKQLDGKLASSTVTESEGDRALQDVSSIVVKF